MFKSSIALFLAACSACILTAGIAVSKAESLDRVGPIEAPSPRPSYPYYVSASVPALHDKLYRRIFQLILNQSLFFNNASAREGPPFEFHSPAALRKLFDFNLPESRVSHRELVQLIGKLFKYSPHMSHPFRVDRHGTGLDPQGLVGEWMATVLTTSMTTYKDSPVFTLMEDSLTERIRMLIGYPEGKGDGIIVPGSAAGNGYAIQSALQSKFPRWKNRGAVQAGASPVAIFLSEDASFAYEKYCIWEGIGSNACVRVPVDANGRMSMQELNRKITLAKSSGRVPLVVIATAGTSILGAIDPLQEISKVAKRHKMWFHVDGQMSGSYFLSEKLKPSLSGLSSADSFLWNPSKGLSVPTVSAVLVSRKDGIFSKTFAFGASVLFQQSLLYNNTKWDNGDKSLQTTRRPGVSGIWFTLRSHGQARLSQRLDYITAMKDFTVAHLDSDRNRFVSILPSFDSHQVAFYYVPSSLRLLPRAIREQILSDTKFTEKLKATLLKEGALSISVDTWRQRRNPFFVMSLQNSVLTKSEIRYMLDIIEYYGERTPLLLGTKSLSSSNVTNSTPNPPKFSLPGLPPIIVPISNGHKPKIPSPASKYPDHVSAPLEALHQSYFKTFFEEVLKNGTYYEDKRSSEAPINFKTPEDLLTLFDFSLTKSTQDSQNLNLQLYRDLLNYNIHNAHPYYDDHLAEALDPYAQMADYVVSTLNSALVTYEDNPVITLMEEQVVKSAIKLVGYPGGQGDGLILPGGSAANEIAMLLALQRKAPDFKQNGLAQINKTFVAFLSDQAHYATNKAAFFIGIGLDGAILVSTDDRGRLDPVDLEQKIRKATTEGKIPFMVVATTGTTVLGAFDPISDIADICEKYKLWLHLDGAYGGPTLFSNDPQRIYSRFQGIERSDSFTFNAHKSLAAAREITCFITRHSQALKQVAPPPSSQEFNNEILYNGRKFDGGINQLFPDRRGNVLKLWFMWEAKGRRGLGSHIDYGYNLTAQAYKLFAARNDSFLLFNPGQPQEATHINFYYVPKGFRSQKLTKSVIQQLAKVQGKLHDRLISKNALFLFQEGVPKMENTLILSVYNSALTPTDIDHMMNLIEYYGEN